MRWIAIGLLIIACASLAKAQNLVPNPGFESKKACPNNRAQVTSHCKDWYQYTYATPDYFHKCSPLWIMQTPKSDAGYQQPVDGDAYVGILMNHTDPLYDYKEYIAAKISPLSIGGIYEVSMHVSLADNSEMATNDLGVYFFEQGPDTAAAALNTGVLPVIPQISYTKYGIRKDTQKWLRVIDTFVADSAYTHMVIGGFHHPDTMQLIPTGVVNSLLEDQAYYFIDSVVMVMIGYAPPPNDTPDNIDPIDPDSSTLTSTLLTEPLCPGDSTTIAYSVWGNSYQAGNIFTLQLSDGSGSFDKPKDIGNVTATVSGTIKANIPYELNADSSYQVRIVSSHPPDTTFAGPIELDDECDLMDIPNAFSPNGDGNNDILYVRGNNVVQVYLRIYNRWGKLIFETTDINKGWDGTVNGKQQDIDVYGYVLSGAFKNGKTMHKQGNISITK